MTKREFLNMVVEGKVTEELSKYAEAELLKMDTALEKRKAKQAEKAKEDDGFTDKIYEALSTKEFMTSTDIGNQFEISPQKASFKLRKLVAEGRAIVQDIKIEKRKLKGYKKA